MNLKGRSCWVVNIRMVRAEKLSLEAMGRFVATSEDIRFEAEDRQQLRLGGAGADWSAVRPAGQGGAGPGGATSRR